MTVRIKDFRTTMKGSCFNIEKNEWIINLNTQLLRGNLHDQFKIYKEMAIVHKTRLSFLQQPSNVYCNQPHLQF